VLPFTKFKPADTALTLQTLYSDPNQQIFSVGSPGLSNAGGY
jgi:hypothetical protein